ncbi:ExbD/TolR family protein [Cetobacterium sp.]|uniref:ExbD/TolR family protein n=2 Tax=Cetobacterium sp. TaxID=2071632 RepID=UPI002FC7DA14
MFRSKGFMNYQKKQLTPDLTPLIDVVFLLLIFFMVATTFDDMRGMKIELPKSEVSELTEVVDKISVILNQEKELKIKITKKDGDVVIDIKKEELVTKLQENLQKIESKRVSILADKGINYGEIVDIMSDIKISGAKAIDIETKGK